MNALHRNPEGVRRRDALNNRTADTGIFRVGEINNLLIILEQGVFGTVRNYCGDSIGWVRLVQEGKIRGVYREYAERTALTF